MGFRAIVVASRRIVEVSVASNLTSLNRLRIA